MNNHKNAKFCTKPKQYEAIFTSRVIRIVFQSGFFVSKYRCCFIKGYTMLASVLPFLAIIP